MARFIVPRVSRQLLPLLTALFSALSLHADTVTLNNGRKLEGVVAEESDASIVFVQSGVRLTLPRATITQIEYASDEERQALVEDIRETKPWHREYYPESARPFLDRVKELEERKDKVERQRRTVDEIIYEQTVGERRLEELETRITRLRAAMDTLDIQNAPRGTPEYPKKVRQHNKLVDAFNQTVDRRNALLKKLANTSGLLAKASRTLGRLETESHVHARTLVRDWKAYLANQRPEDRASDWAQRLNNQVSQHRPRALTADAYDHVHTETLDNGELKVTVTADAGGHFILPLRLNDTYDARLLLDTGATTVLLYREAARLANVRILNQRGMAEVADGRMVEVSRGFLKELDLFGRYFSMLPVDVIDAEATNQRIDGLLGMTLLNQFDVRIADNRLILRIKPPEH